MAVPPATGWDEQEQEVFWNNDFFPEINPSLQPRSRDPSVFDRWSWGPINVHASQTSRGTAKEGEGSLYASWPTTSNGLHVYPAVPSQHVVPGGDMIPTSSSCNLLTPPSRFSADVKAWWLCGSLAPCCCGACSGFPIWFRAPRRGVWAAHENLL
jgi:hypothetical protein